MRRDSKRPSVSDDARFFTELSGELDRRLDHHAQLLGGLRPEWFGEAYLSDELAAVLFEYLGRRIALEHVFFGRSARGSRLEVTRMRAEVWRWQKIVARDRAAAARVRKRVAGTPLRKRTKS